MRQTHFNYGKEQTVYSTMNTSHFKEHDLA